MFNAKNKMHKIINVLIYLLCSAFLIQRICADENIYKIDFEMPDFDKNPEMKSQLMTFFTHENEKYDCVIPVIKDSSEEPKDQETELSPMLYLQPLFASSICSFRIEAYWSYELCHGQHVRQFHEEREGKNIKFQEYFLGKISPEELAKTVEEWNTSYEKGFKYRTTKIDNTRYPYIEIKMTDGTICDIINAPRTTVVRYVCYPHGKNEIYSFKETSSCNYEAVILTSVLCMAPSFHPKESREVSIKCFNSPTETHKPLSMLKQELKDMHLDEGEVSGVKSLKDSLNGLHRTRVVDRFIDLEKFSNIDKLAQELLSGSRVDADSQNDGNMKATSTLINELTPIKEFISGKNCLTGGTGWWKYEFCYGRYVRQFHKDKKSETELFLGYFSEEGHRKYIASNPEKAVKPSGLSKSIWHHYENGDHCDRTGLPREVDVKLTCSQITNSATAVSMYLLEPKTCQYILVVDSPIICDLMKIIDEHGVVKENQLQELIKIETLSAEEDLKETTTDRNPDTGNSEEQESREDTSTQSEGKKQSEII